MADTHDIATTPPSAWQIERTLAAWHQAKDALAADVTLAADENAIAEALGADPATLTADDLLERLVNATVWAEMRTAEAKGLAAVMAERKQRYERRAEVMRDTLLQLMQTLQRKHFDARLARASLARAAASVVVLDAAQVPAEYAETERKLKRREILADLKHGVVIDGVTLAEGGVTLQLRAR
jgi:hypothetical protein